MKSDITEILIADSKRLDEKMTAKYGTPFWHGAMMLEAWRETMQTKTFPHNMGETIKPKSPHGTNA
jgi:hypothetical protein